MRSRLPILIGLILAVAVALLPGRLPRRGRTRPTESPGAGRPGDEQPITSAAGGRKPSTSATERSDDGQKLIARAAGKVFRYQSLSARIRLRVHLLEQNLVGTGRYFQLGSDAEKLVRLDLKIRASDRETRLQQVCDGRNLWVYQDMPSLTAPDQRQATVSRVDLRQIRAMIQRQGSSPANMLSPDQLTEGGLANLLNQLNANFDFQQVSKSTLSGLPMWTVRGGWKPDRLARILPQPKGAIPAGERASHDALPDHVPNVVAVCLGREDLFPYRIEYFRVKVGSDPALVAGPPAESTAVVTMELFEVATNDVIDPRRFQFQAPTNLEVHDRTDQYLARLKAARAR